MTAQLMRELFLETLREKNQLFDELDDSNEIIRLDWREGDNLDEISIYVSFKVLDDGTEMAHVGCYDLPNFSDRFDKGVRICNQLNDDELVKYYIDDEGDAVTTTTLVFGACGVSVRYSPELVLTYANLTALSVDDAYAILSRA